MKMSFPWPPQIPPPCASASSIVGLQWGDEGKGKIVDLLTSI